MTVIIITDHLGTPRVVTDKNKSVLWRMEGDQFGNVQPQIEKIKLPLRHAGQYADDESGLFYNYFRYYNPNMGRYIENDPIGLEGGINTYGYVAGSPLMGIDFYGLSPRDVKKIKNAINKSILDMTNKGERINGGYKNNACRRYPILSKMWVDCGKNPDKLKDCGDQVDTTLVEIKKNNFDDVWTCNYDSGTGHAWGFCVARTNKTDPIIWFDPRANQISEDKPCASCHPYLYLPPLYGEKYIKNLQGDLQ